MAVSVELPLVLTSQNAVTLLIPLSVEQTKQLIFHLGIELNVLDDIETQHKGDSFKMHAFQTWLNYDVEASWDKVISGLKKIRMNTLAEKVSTKAKALVNVGPSIDQESSAIVSPVESVDTSTQTQVASVTTVVPHADSTESFIPSTCSSAVDKRRVAEVKDCIDQLEDAFSDLISDTRSSMTEKESQDYKFLDRLRDHLLVLPIAKKATHAKFFKENEDDIIKAESIRRLFAILSRYCNYSNYEILFHLVKKFGEDALKKKMLDYCESLKRFEMTTTVDVYLPAISAGHEISKAFSRMVMKIKKPPSMCTLHDIRKFKEALAEKATIHSYCMYIESVAESSVEVVVRFPPDCIAWILAAMTPDFLCIHDLTEVVVDGQQLIISHSDREKLVCVITMGMPCMICSILYGKKGSVINLQSNSYSKMLLRMYLHVM